MLSPLFFSTHAQVECITTADRSLYVGTADGCISYGRILARLITKKWSLSLSLSLSLIVYYQLEENLSPLGKTIYRSKVKGRIQLGGEKLQNLMIFIDGTKTPNMN